MVYDCLIIGAGVVGASIFNKLTRVGQKCLMIDKASDVATGASKANSGIIHAGHDPIPNTLKAKFNVRGNKLFPSICERLGIKLNKCGALIVGNDKDKIEELYNRGKENGVYVEIWNQKQLLDKVPFLSKDIKLALFARDSYVISPYLFTIALTEEAILNGSDVSLEEDIVSLKKENDIYILKTQKGEYKTKVIINCAGGGYNDVAKLLKTEEYPIEYRRGEYFVFDKGLDMTIPCTIFPLPTRLGKGVLITPTIDGNFLVGPTSDENTNSVATTKKGMDSIKEKAKLIVPTLDFRNAIREFAGIRTISGDDFIVEKSKLKEDIINIAGICSPGLSSAPAIAEYVLELLSISKTEKEQLKQIEPYIMFKNMPVDKKKKLMESDENCKKIVCKCEEITKYDILNALRRPLKISSVDAIKRRTNSGMGRCQGGFCFNNVVKIIAEERGILFENVKKENRGSEVAVGNIREVKDEN